MNVFVVLDHPGYEGETDVWGIFTSKKKARRALVNHSNDLQGAKSMDVEEWEMDKLFGYVGGRYSYD